MKMPVQPRYSGVGIGIIMSILCLSVDLMKFTAAGLLVDIMLLNDAHARQQPCVAACFWSKLSRAEANADYRHK